MCGKRGEWREAGEEEESRNLVAATEKGGKKATW